MNTSAAPLVFLFLLAFYFFPAWVANYRHHHQTTAILVLNLFLGWTVLGWVGALVWASTAVKPRKPSKPETDEEYWSRQW